MDFPTLIRFSRKLLWKTGLTPEYVLFQATSRCNLKCAHCFLWADTDYGWENTNFGKYDLTLAEIQTLSKSMPDFYFINMTGGEPMLRADLPEIIQSFYANNRLRAALIPSNGTALERTLLTVSRVMDTCPELSLAVDISLDGIGALHDKIRGVEGSFDKAVKTFKMLQELQKKYQNLQLGVIIAFMRSNQEVVEEIYDFVKAELAPDSIAVALVRGNPLDGAEKQVDMRRYASLVARLETDLVHKEVGGFRKTLLPGLTVAAKIKMHHEILETVERGYQSPCYAAGLNVVIYSNGDVYPCEVLGPDKKIGNLREVDMDFRKLWDTPRRREIAKWIVGSKCHCTHECHIPVNLLFNPRRLPSLLKPYRLAR